MLDALLSPMLLFEHEKENYKNCQEPVGNKRTLSPRNYRKTCQAVTIGFTQSRRKISICS